VPEQVGDQVVPTRPVPDADGAGPGAAHLSLAESAAVVGGYAWIERQLAAVVGTWVTRMALPAVQVHLAAQSARHGWHAELWAERLPRLDGIDIEALCRPPTPAVGEVIDALDPSRRGLDREQGWGEPARVDQPAASGTAPGALPLLAGLYRVVLPRLVVSYQAHLRVAMPVSDGPVIRALRLVVADEMEDWRDGELLVQQLVRRPHDVDAVSDFQKELEAVLVRAGIHPGLTGLPDGTT
jgi:hypothetical protein